MFYPVPAPVTSRICRLSTKAIPPGRRDGVGRPGWIPTRSVLLPVIAFIGDLGILNQKRVLEDVGREEISGHCG